MEVKAVAEIRRTDKGILIVLYGGHNRGKSIQAEELIKALKKMNHKVRYIKYPVYDLFPTGPRINDYMRQGNSRNIEPKYIQILCVRNMINAQKELVIPSLRNGEIVLAEDYMATTLAYAMATGLDSDFITTLRELQRPIVHPDFAFIFKGKRFKEAMEKNHAHESVDEIAEKAHENLLVLADEFNMIPVKSDEAIPLVTGEILSYIFPKHQKIPR